MDKEKIINDLNFRLVCRDFGVDWKNFEVYDDVIIIDSPKIGIYVLLDKNYNIIGVHKTELSTFNLSKSELCLGYSELYNTINEDARFRLCYPFQNFSLKQIVDISNRIEIIETNHEHSSEMLVNGELVDGENDSTYIELLSYIKILGKEIKEYYSNCYQMYMMNFDYPNVIAYINQFIYNIDECINKSISTNERPFPIDILRYTARIKFLYDYANPLYGVIDLLMRQKGAQAKSGFEYYKEVEPVLESDVDLSIFSSKLIKILEVTDEEVKRNEEDSFINMKWNHIDLCSWLNDDKIKVRK